MRIIDVRLIVDLSMNVTRWFCERKLRTEEMRYRGVRRLEWPTQFL